MPTSLNPDCDLLGTTVVVTRAAAQAQSLCDLIETCNGLPLLLPALDIQWLALTELQRQTLTVATAKRPPIVIFTSANAVESVARAMASHRITLRPGITCIAIGSATAAALDRIGQPSEVAGVPTSEGVAQMALLARPDDRQLLVVRGEGGREVLASFLQANGWLVEEFIAYRRRLPQLDSGPLFDRWKSARNVAVTFMSGDTARNLVNMAQSVGQSELELVKSTPAAVISDRVRGVVEASGWRASIAVARTPTAQSMIVAVSSIMNKT